MLCLKVLAQINPKSTPVSKLSGKLKPTTVLPGSLLFAGTTNKSHATLANKTGLAYQKFLPIGSPKIQEHHLHPNCNYFSTAHN